MAVFMINICKFNGCGLIFPGLGDLIQHIEDKHIDYDPVVVEQKEQSQPACIPLSYVLRFFAEEGRQENVVESSKLKEIESGTGMKCSNSNSSIDSSGRSSTPTGSDMEDEDGKSDSEDSNDSWTTPEEFSAEVILSLAMKTRAPAANKKNGAGGWAAATKDNSNPDKPFACPVPGCKKRYKNVNGIKYHSKNGHKKDSKVRKGFKCHCGKSYKTAQGLKTHASAYHSGTSLTTITTSTGEVLQIPTSQVATLQPVRTLTVKQLPPASSTSLNLPVKSIQGVVFTTRPTNELIYKNSDMDNKTTTVRVLKDITVPVVKSTVPLQVTQSALQYHLSTTNLNDNDTNQCKMIEGVASTGILDEIERISHLAGHDPLIGENIPMVNLEGVNQDELDNNSLLKIKLDPEKDKFMRIMPNDEFENIQLESVQIQLPDPKITLPAIEPASINLTNPQAVASLGNMVSPNLDSINMNRSQTQEDLGIITPIASPPNSPEIRLNQLQNNPPLSPLTPLTPISQIENKVYLPNILQLPELIEPEKMDEPDLLLEDMDIHLNT